MMTPCRAAGLLIATALALALSGCATAPLEPPAEDLRAVTPGSVLRSLTIDPAVEARILALDPNHISDDDVRNALAKGPTPRIFAIHGGVYGVYLLMESFGHFLTGMGYPEPMIRDSGDGAYSRSPYEDSAQQAGEIAWYYEHEGVRPMLVGHSQGGIQVVKILHELAGTFGAERRVFNPLTGQFEDRTTIVDPLTGRERPVVGVSVADASVVGTGGWALALPVHWKVVPDHPIDSRHRRRVHRLSDRAGSLRLGCAGLGKRKDLSRRRQGDRAQCHAAGRVFARLRPATRRSSPSRRRCGRGSTRSIPTTSRGARRCRTGTRTT